MSNPYAAQSDYESRFQQGPYGFQRNPLMQQSTIGTPGLSTGFAPADMLMNMVMGNTLRPKPNDGESQYVAMTRRRRSMEGFNAMGNKNFANNVFSDHFGGFGGILPQGMAMADAMTGGMGQGVVSKLLSPLLGGSPIAAQQKLYAGLNGITRSSSFGLRGETSLKETDNVIGGMRDWFYKQDRNKKDLSSFMSNEANNITNTTGTKEALTKALSEAAGSSDTKAAFAKLGKEFGTVIDKEMQDRLVSRSKKSLYGNIDFSKTYGYTMEQATGAFVALSQHGLISSRGKTENEVLNGVRDKDGNLVAGKEGFARNEGYGMVRAAQNLFGSKNESSAIGDLNAFMGVSNFNADRKGDIERFTTQAHRFEAASVSTGISKQDLLQLVEAIRDISKKNGIGNRIGGSEAGDIALRTLSRTQALLTSGSADTGYLRRNGGVVGVTNSVAAQAAAVEAALPTTQLNALYGAAHNEGNEAAKREIEDYMRNPDNKTHDSFVALQRSVGKKIGYGVMAINGVLGNSTTAAQGKDALDARNAANPNDVLRPSKTTEKMIYQNYLDTTFAFQDGDRKRMETILNSETEMTPEQALKEYNNTAQRKITAEEETQHFYNKYTTLRNATPQGRKIQDAMDAQNLAEAKISADMEVSMSAVRGGVSGSIVRSLMDGSAFKGGMNSMFKEQLLTSKDTKLQALANLSESTDLGKLIGVLAGDKDTTGQYLQGVTYKELDTAENGKSVHGNKTLKTILEQLDATAAKDAVTPEEKKAKAQAAAMREAMVDKDGNFKKDAFKKYISEKVGRGSVEAVLKNDENYQKLLTKVDTSLTDNLEAVNKGRDKDKQLTVAGLKELGSVGVGNLAAESGVTEEQKRHFQVMQKTLELKEKAEGEAVDDAKTSGVDTMDALVKAIGGDGSGLIKVIMDLQKAITDIPTGT